MPKQWTAQRINSMGTMDFEVDALGNLTALNVHVEINCGDTGMNEVVDVFKGLNAGQRTAANQMHKNIRRIVEKEILN